MKEEKEIEKNVEKKVKEVLEKLNPYLQDDGGNVTFKRYENGVVYVKLEGACAHCPMQEMTLENGIEEALTSEIPEVVKVINED